VFLETVSGEISYHLTLKLIRGTTLKVMENYDINHSTNHKTLSKIMRIEDIQSINNIFHAVHNFLVSLNKKSTPSIAALEANLAECITIKNLIYNPCVRNWHLSSAIWHIADCYSDILSKMLHRKCEYCQQDVQVAYPVLFNNIIFNKLVGAILHHSSIFRTPNIFEPKLLLQSLIG